jgi:hypothetical protein
MTTIIDSLQITLLVAVWIMTLLFITLLVQMARQARTLSRVLEEIANVHNTFNSKMDMLLQVTGQAEHAKGVLEGRSARGPAPSAGTQTTAQSQPTNN